MKYLLLAGLILNVSAYDNCVEFKERNSAICEHSEGIYKIWQDNGKSTEPTNKALFEYYVGLAVKKYGADNRPVFYINPVTGEIKSTGTEKNYDLTNVDLCRMDMVAENKHCIKYCRLTDDDKNLDILGICEDDQVHGDYSRSVK